MPQQQQRSLLESLLTAGGLLPYQVTPPHDWQEAAQQAQRAKPLLDLILGQMPEAPPQGADFGQRLAYILGTPGVFPAGMTAFHGTPHTFAPVPENPLGAFDLSKIGTGEGAQAYGHGIYLAENPDVAGHYRYSGGVPSFTHTAHGTPISSGLSTKLEAAWRDMMQSTYGPSKQGAADLVNSNLGRVMESAAKANDWNLWQWAMDMGNELHRVMQDFPAPKAGRVLHVDLPDEHIAKMLDWDKPLSEQDPGVAARALEALHPRHVPVMREINASGADLYRTLASDMPGPYSGDTYRAASEALAAKGIPGIKYLDAGSRAAGEGSKNFVLFDPSIARIVKAE